MIVIRLSGGMGNQMFQYAFGRAMAASLNTDLKIDCSLLLDRARGKDYVYREYDLSIFKIKESFTFPPSLLRLIFKVQSSTVGRLVRQSLAKGMHYEKEKYFHVDQELLASPKNNTMYEGWWQSEDYFAPVSAEIRKHFQFKAPVLAVSKDIHDRIQQTNSVCLNVRRTDFLTNSTLNATDLSYFLRAAGKMAEKVDDPHFFVFSDDTAWCEQNIVLDHPVEVVPHTVKGEKFGNYMQLMKACRHFIIPNSSFAWWAAWLCENPDKVVIAPEQWFGDGQYDTSNITPANWIRI